jgi:hypothetical protein
LQAHTLESIPSVTREPPLLTTTVLDVPAPSVAVIPPPSVARPSIVELPVIVELPIPLKLPTNVSF